MTDQNKHETTAPADEATDGEPDAQAQADEGKATGLAGIRKITWWAIGIATAIFVYFVVADRTTPFSGDARVQAFILRVAPEISGRVLRVNVSDNQIVEAEETLFEIDPTPFEIAVAEAQARLDQAGQNVGSSTASVDTAQAKLDEARANAVNIRVQSERALELVRRGIYAKAREDDAVSSIQKAEAGVDSAEAELQRAKEELGPEGADNPQIKEALAALESARYDLSRTKMSAPSLGVVTNLQLAAGQTVNAGQPAMTFISAEDVWLVGSLRENSISVIKPGQRAEMVLDNRPGEVFPATVGSVGWGVGGGDVDPQTGLPTSTGEESWLTDPQRFPVILQFDETNRPRGSRYGSRAAVIVYSSDNVIMNAIAWARIRLISIVTYVS